MSVDRSLTSVNFSSANFRFTYGAAKQYQWHLETSNGHSILSAYNSVMCHADCGTNSFMPQSEPNRHYLTITTLIVFCSQAKL